MLKRAESQAGRRPRLLLMWLCCLTIALMVLDRVGMLTPITEQTAKVLAPIERTFTSLRQTIGEAVGGLTNSSDVQQQNTALQAEITRLQNENLTLRGAAAENVQLRRTAGMRERHGWRTTIASVIGRSPDGATRMLTIDRGRADGLEIGMPVIAHVGGSPDALIGLIDSLTDQTATVLLITDARSVISGHILSKQTATVDTQPVGEVVGRWQLGSRLEMHHLERDAPVAAGDYVLTAGISRAILADTPAARVPPDIPIGEVLTVQAAGNGQIAEIQPYFDPDQVRTVWIIVGGD